MLLIVATAVAVSLVPLVVAWRAKRHTSLAARTLSRQARRLPATAVDKLVEGALARTIGTVRPSGPWLVAPFSKTPCAYWRFSIRALVYAPHATWRDVFDDEQGCRFVLKSGDARCLVEPVELDVPGAGRVCADMPRTKRLRVDPRALPPAVADVLDRYNLDLPLAPLVIEEYALAIDRDVAVAGIVTRVDDPAAAETDYRSGRPTLAAFHASAGDLLLSSTDRHLRSTKATLIDPVTASPSAAKSHDWGLPDVDAQGTPIASLAAFEAELERKREQRRTVAGIVTAVIVIGAIGVAFSSLLHSDTRRDTTAHRELIVHELDKSRERLSRVDVDRAWRVAMASRHGIMGVDEPCPVTSWLHHRLRETWRYHHDGRERTPLAQVVIGPNDILGPSSPRTVDAWATLQTVSDFVERGFDVDAEGTDIVEDARLTRLDRYDIVVDRIAQTNDRTTGQNARLEAYLYDHLSERIVCVGTAVVDADSTSILPVYDHMRAAERDHPSDYK